MMDDFFGEWWSVGLALLVSLGIIAALMYGCVSANFDSGVHQVQPTATPIAQKPSKADDDDDFFEEMMAISTMSY
jgi:hypothetical protein